MFVNKIKFFSKFYIEFPKKLTYSKLGVTRSFCSADMKAGNQFCDQICWMDMEMTGLDVKKDTIMEISCLITDKDLNILSEGPSIVIHQPQETLENMNSWCKKQHNKTGLTKQCLESQITVGKAEEILLEYLQQNIPKGKVPLAGNSIYMDRLFLRHYLPRVDDYLHYRVIDVSTIKELARRWNNEVMSSAPKKELKHRSLDDIKESISELQYYREHFFKQSQN